MNSVLTKFLGAATLGVSLFAMAAPATAGDAESCKAVRFADVGWTDIQVTTGCHASPARSAGLCAGSEDPVGAGDLCLAEEQGHRCVPRQLDAEHDRRHQGLYSTTSRLRRIGTNLEGAGYGLVVPQYVADAGVKSLADLGANKDKFDGKIYGIEAGNDGNRIIQTMIDDAKNNLAGFELVESSEAGMLTEAEKAMKNNEWIIFLGWTPHPVMGEMKIALSRRHGRFRLRRRHGLYQCAGGLCHANARMPASCCRNLKFNLAMEGAMMEPVLKDGADPKATALAWLKANPDAVKPWLEGVTTFDGGDAAAAVSAALQVGLTDQYDISFRRSSCLRRKVS